MKRSLLALALASLLPLSANATDLSNSYFQGGYSSLRTEGTNFDGLGLKGSLNFNDDWYGTVTYDRGTKSGLEIDESSLNVGYRYGLSDKTDLYAEAGWVHDKIDVGVPGYNFKDNGYRVTGGVRSALSDNFEGNFHVSYADVGDYGNGAGAGVGGLFKINPMWGITAEVENGKVDDVQTTRYMVGVRASF
jgi:hypothetical protein